VAINVDLVADASEAIRESGKLGDALETVADQLDDIGDQGKTVDDKVSEAFRGMEDGAKDAGRTVEDKVGDAFRSVETDAKDAGRTVESKVGDAFRAVAADAKAAGKTIGQDVKDGTDKAGDGMGELRDEAAGTAREAAASFGSLEDGLGALQEVAANALVGFGPAGMVAGLAAAAGIGLAMTAMQDAATTATEAKQKAVDMVDAIAEAGGNLADVDLADRIKSWGREVLDDNWMTFWADESSTKFQETAKDAEAFGVKATDAIRAASGSAEDSRKFLEETADDWQTLNDRVEQGTRVSTDGAIAFDDGAKAAQRQRDALSDLRGQAEENIATTENAVQIYELETDAIGDTAAATEAATEALRDRAAALEESATSAMDADAAELDYMETLQQSTKDIQSNGRTVDINTEAGRANRLTLLEMAGSARKLIDAQIAQGDSTATVTKRTQAARDSFINAATSAGMTKDAARRLADQYGLIPGNVDTHVKAHNVANTEREINNVARARTVPVHISPSGAQNVANYITGMNGQKVYVDVVPRGGGRGLN